MSDFFKKNPQIGRVLERIYNENKNVNKSWAVRIGLTPYAIRHDTSYESPILFRLEIFGYGYEQNINPHIPHNSNLQDVFISISPEANEFAKAAAYLRENMGCKSSVSLCEHEQKTGKHTRGKLRDAKKEIFDLETQLSLGKAELAERQRKSTETEQKYGLDAEKMRADLQNYFQQLEELVDTTGHINLGRNKRKIETLLDEMKTHASIDRCKTN